MFSGNIFILVDHTFAHKRMVTLIREDKSHGKGKSSSVVSCLKACFAGTQPRLNQIFEKMLRQQ